MSDQLGLLASATQPASQPLNKAVTTVPRRPKFHRPKVKPAPVDSQAVYGRCRCGEPFRIPGLKTELCPQCGWVGSEEVGRIGN